MGSWERLRRTGAGNVPKFCSYIWPFRRIGSLLYRLRFEHARQFARGVSDEELHSSLRAAGDPLQAQFDPELDVNEALVELVRIAISSSRISLEDWD